MFNCKNLFLDKIKLQIKHFFKKIIFSNTFPFFENLIKRELNVKEYQRGRILIYNHKMDDIFY